ncbi:hypothetical protein BDK51DRAFT_41293 [Blyttiomyces helicus]|uniref:Peroxin/Ferlin domain-containing protein n=1 Tax=Blyttiomyces helicus TaxID=388810 RepID=A0A4P9W5E2_9FUNG|nr:hypothetical protein BDK51DRAFT_41293 [Blyttiomyces helicus]|eukprot:RKO87172.1 hypothetical protein BDK51DRAFT_41293 [Blyttiomyces helicus]
MWTKKRRNRSLIDVRKHWRWTPAPGRVDGLPLSRSLPALLFSFSPPVLPSSLLPLSPPPLLPFSPRPLVPSSSPPGTLPFLPAYLSSILAACHSIIDTLDSLVTLVTFSRRSGPRDSLAAFRAALASYVVWVLATIAVGINGVILVAGLIVLGWCSDIGETLREHLGKDIIAIVKTSGLESVINAEVDTEGVAGADEARPWEHSGWDGRLPVGWERSFVGDTKQKAPQQCGARGGKLAGADPVVPPPGPAPRKPRPSPTRAHVVKPPVAQSLEAPRISRVIVASPTEEAPELPLLPAAPAPAPVLAVATESAQVPAPVVVAVRAAVPVDVGNGVTVVTPKKPTLDYPPSRSSSKNSIDVPTPIISEIVKDVRPASPLESISSATSTTSSPPRTIRSDVEPSPYTTPELTPPSSPNSLSTLSSQSATPDRTRADSLSGPPETDEAERKIEVVDVARPPDVAAPPPRHPSPPPPDESNVSIDAHPDWRFDSDDEIDGDGFRTRLYGSLTRSARAGSDAPGPIENNEDPDNDDVSDGSTLDNRDDEDEEADGMWAHLRRRRSCDSIVTIDALAAQLSLPADIAEPPPPPSTPTAFETAWARTHASAQPEPRQTRASSLRGSNRKPLSVVLSFETYENQRWWVGLGWVPKLLPAERGPWTDHTGGKAQPRSSFDLGPFRAEQLASLDVSPSLDPSKRYAWGWDGEWTPDKAGAGVQTDDDGWEYADNFWAGWKLRKTLKRVVRRRRWTRLARLYELGVRRNVTFDDVVYEEPLRRRARSAAALLGREGVEEEEDAAEWELRVRAGSV